MASLASESADESRAGIAWLLADMTLVSIMAAIVKAQGATYPAVQLVFLRATIGLVAIAPLVWRHRAEVIGTRRAGRHAFRVACNAAALTGNFAALAALPLALVTAIGFTRPLVAMTLAVLLLGERVMRARWLYAIAALGAVVVMIAPSGAVWNVGLLAAGASVLFGSLAAVQTRALRTESPTVMMVFYTLGLAILTAPFAGAAWVALSPDDLPAIVCAGLLAQAGQYCFLRAYRAAPASVLAPIGYLSIVFSAATGYLVFGERPTWGMVAGAALIVVILHLDARTARRASSPPPKADGESR
ncbi:DMT family transporter [Salinarimonas ramus]|uniref:Multidrug transporter n=1 Tax=Salinarimonas ramus TaxID=690164 RepID=A0A917QB77_9HYPH|nr:DMT family transporter [Salinarimonas ramus]GGK41312.1 multidrug transporter [Salinarimonas ramus]